MNNKVLIIIVTVLCLLLGATAYYFYTGLQEQQAENADLKELAEMDKREMENEYAQFAIQYDELKRSIRNDSLMARLTEEEARTQSLLAELKKVKSTNAAEITRLKRELATVREVLKSYIHQVDSLNRINEQLTKDNQTLQGQLGQANSSISTLTNEKEALAEKVNTAAQLDATGITILAQNKKGKAAKRTKDIERFQVNFAITKNITAATGNRQVYLRILKPNNEVLSQMGTTKYESANVGYSAQKTVEYTGEDCNVTMYVAVSEFLSPGTYRAQIIIDGHMIGSTTMTMEK